MSIFADNARHHWSVGLPAIPLMERQKRPAIARWQMYADRMVEQDEVNAGLFAFPDGNIGLPMPPAWSRSTSTQTIRW